METCCDEMFTLTRTHTHTRKWQISAPAVCTDKSADSGCQMHMQMSKWLRAHRDKLKDTNAVADVDVEERKHSESTAYENIRAHFFTCLQNHSMHTNLS